MEGQSVNSGQTVVVKTRRRSADLSPGELVSRLIYARKDTGKAVTFQDYCTARGGSPDIDPGTFGELLLRSQGDPGFSWREHFFRPVLRDAGGRTYEILEHLPDRINLLRDDGVQGYTTPEELRSCFTPIDETQRTDKGFTPGQPKSTEQENERRRNHEQ